MKPQQTTALSSSPEMDFAAKELINQFAQRSDIWSRYFKDDAATDFTVGKSKEEPSSKVSEQYRDKPVVPLVLPVQSAVEDRGVALQKWDGVVTEVKEDTFIARLYDKTADSPEEEAELLIVDISDDDLPLITPGAVFYLSLGYIIKNTGQKFRCPIIKFRRLPAWTRRELKDIDERVRERKALIGWGTDEDIAENTASAA